MLKLKRSSNRVYFNPAQRKVMAVGAHSSCIIGARAIGKSEGIDAVELLDDVQLMPRSLGGIITPTYTKLLRNTMPAVKHGLARLGCIEGVHYVIGRVPPKSFRRPYIAPSSWDNCMVFWNGACAQFISQDGVMSANSMSLDWVIGFEAKFLDKSKIDNEVVPANRGNKQYFGSCYKHHGMHYSTDRPTLESGRWVLELRKQMDPDIYRCVVACYSELTELKRRYFEAEGEASRTYYASLITAKRRELNLFRSHLFYYDEFSSLDNIDVLGVEWFFMMKRTLPPYIFMLSILNMDMRKVSDCFYPHFSEATHCYVPDNSSFVMRHDFNEIAKEYRNCLLDGDLRYDIPLVIALDYNAPINNLVVGQHVDNELRTLITFYVKSPRKLADLVEVFCRYYEPFISKQVAYYYDSTANWETASQSEKYFETVVRVLERNRWSVTPIYIGQPERHDVKYSIFSEGFCRNPEFIYPSFNKFSCEELIISFGQAKCRITRNGFEKDKSLEKKPDSQEHPDEYKTHITDAWDTLYLGCLNHPYQSVGANAGITII